MRVICKEYDIDDLIEYAPMRIGAQETWDVICGADKGRDFIAALEMEYPDGIDEQELDQLLAWDEKYCLELSGMGQKQGEGDGDEIVA